MQTLPREDDASVLPSELLKAMQLHGRSEVQDRNNLLTEMQVLLSFLQSGKPHELAVAEQGAMGGLLYCLRRLYERAEATHSLDVVAERYAQAELEDYPEASPEATGAAATWAQENNVFLRLIEIPSPDGKKRFMLASHQRQTTIDGTSYEEGEFVHNPLRVRSNPPFATLLKYLRDKGWL